MYGIVDKHWRAIAEETGLPRERVEQAILNLEAPDPESRSPEMDGCRIIKMDEHRAWGWKIVNYGKYRSIRDEDDRREQNRIAQEKFRNKNKAGNQEVSNSKHDVIDNNKNKPRKPISAQEEEEAEGEEEAEAINQKRSTPQSAVAKKSNPVDVEIQTSCKETWKSYSTAYFNRYGTDPVRNAKVSSQIKQFVARIGATESPPVAAHFVASNSQFYVSKGHAVGLLLADAEKLRTEWATGRTMTATRARQMDKTQANGSIVAEAMAILEKMNEQTT